MTEFRMARANGRNIPLEDAIFGVGNRATARIEAIGREKVYNGTIGMLQDEEGKTIVFSTVDRVLHELGPEEYAPYAPIGGTPGFRKAVIQSAFRDFTPKDQVRAVATPGGTGALMLAMANYTEEGDVILTSDWHWGPYARIAGERGRTVDFFRLFNENNQFDIEDFRRMVGELLQKQNGILIILNTPAQNPTGYCMTEADWKAVIAVLEDQPKDKKIALVADTAYIDFGGEETEMRNFLPLLDDLQDNIFVMLAYSFSKTFTMYGMRCGALVCMAQDEERADEFVRACEYTARASWSNCPRISQTIITKIFEDPALLAEAREERAEIRSMLLERGRAFEEEAKKIGLDMLPFDGGFFTVIPCDDPKALGAKLEEQNIFLIPFGRGLRVSVACLSLEKCRSLPAKILEAMQN